MESVATFNFYLIKISLSSLAGFLYCGKGGDLQTKKMPQLKSGLYKLQCLLHRWSFGNSPDSLALHSLTRGKKLNTEFFMYTWTEVRTVSSTTYYFMRMAKKYA